MRIIRIGCDSRERLEGFIAGLEYVNDSVIEVESFDAQEGMLVLNDRDGEDGDDRSYRLTREGLW